MDNKNNSNDTKENNYLDEELDKEYLDLFMKKLERSKDDFKNGRCMSFEESRAEFERFYQQYLLERNKF